MIAAQFPLSAYLEHALAEAVFDKLEDGSTSSAAFGLWASMDRLPAAGTPSCCSAIAGSRHRPRLSIRFPS